MRLRELREEHGLTQDQLAHELGLHVNTISQYERGLREPDFAMVRKICAFFKVTSDYLLEISDN